MPTQNPQRPIQKPSRGIRICIIAAVAIVGALILDRLEVSRAAPPQLYVARILGGAVIPFIIAVIPSALIRHWSALLIGIVIICVMDYFVAQGILASQPVH